MVFAPGYTYAEYPQGRQSLPIDKQIDAFHKSYRVWQLDIAVELAQRPDAGFAVLALLNPYLETYARHYYGYTSKEARGQTGDLYGKGLKLIFPSLANNEQIYTQVGKILYEASRCAVAHLGLTGAGIHLSETEYNYPLTVHQDQNGKVIMVGIHPKLWSQAISCHLDHYVEELKDVQNSDLRAKFSRCFLSPF